MDLTEDTLQPEQPDKDQPDKDQPDKDQPDKDQPDKDQPETEQLEPEKLEPEKLEPKKFAAPADERTAAIQSRITEFNGNLRWKENMVLACITNEIDEAYRKNWIVDSNMFFRRAAILKKRLG